MHTGLWTIPVLHGLLNSDEVFATLQRQNWSCLYAKKYICGNSFLSPPSCANAKQALTQDVMNLALNALHDLISCLLNYGWYTLILHTTLVWRPSFRSRLHNSYSMSSRAGICRGSSVYTKSPNGVREHLYSIYIIPREVSAWAQEWTSHTSRVC